MPLPLSIHRRIPLIRRPFYQRDMALAELNAARIERDRALAERDAARQERDAARQERDAAPVHHEEFFIIQKSFPHLRSAARKILSLLRPRNVTGLPLVRKGGDFDGGYVMLDHGLQNSIAYSLGIGDDVSWDLEMAALDCEIFQYDHTIDGLPAEHPNFHWSKIGISETPDDSGRFMTIADLIRFNGHEDRRDLTLKMDIEGAEWKILERLPEEILCQFSQIVMEMHGFINIDDASHRHLVISVLEKIGGTHQIVHVHANNYGVLGMFGGIVLPETFEVTCVRRADHRFEQCHKIFPTELDRPCNRERGDIFLGAMGML
jgi:hypothetical protein